MYKQKRKVTIAKVVRAIQDAEVGRGMWLSRRGVAEVLGVKVTPYLIGALDEAIRRGYIMSVKEQMPNKLVRHLYRMNGERGER